MAVKAPTAPVPPTPPSVPGVTLKDGGTAQETNIPHDKQQTGDEQAEAQARQAVARGDGALSKTTQAKPEKAGQKCQACGCQRWRFAGESGKLCTGYSRPERSESGKSPPAGFG